MVNLALVLIKVLYKLTLSPSNKISEEMHRCDFIRIFLSFNFILDCRQSLIYPVLMTDPMNVAAVLEFNEAAIQIVDPCIQKAIMQSRMEEGVIRYDVYRVKERKGIYVFLEQYKDQQARQQHVQTVHFSELMNGCEQYLVKQPIVAQLLKEPM